MVEQGGFFYINQFFLFYFYFTCVYMYSGACEGQKKALDSQELDFSGDWEQPHWCWKSKRVSFKSNTLIAEPSFQPLRNQLSSSLVDLISNQRGRVSPSIHGASTFILSHRLNHFSLKKESWKEAVKNKTALVGVMKPGIMNS